MPKEGKTKSNTRHARPVKINAEEAMPSASQNLKRAKHEDLMQHIEASNAPYSKSHARRVKRKSKEQLATGMSDILHTLSDDHAEEPLQNQPSTSRPDPKSKAKQIGEGKGITLTKKQRQKELATERLRHPLILSNPHFSVNPFETIRTHARNTLLQHSIEASSKYSHLPRNRTAN